MQRSTSRPILCFRVGPNLPAFTLLNDGQSPEIADVFVDFETEGFARLQWSATGQEGVQHAVLAATFRDLGFLSLGKS